ncbi:MAG TPA: adenylate kinase [Dietzia timorensis]|uniref:Adenylate kinase n=1 Tax=Dietzia timorensis TaxID=499555 RepID=A0A921F2W0_9ACTN|nr:adenylate kinase [Dietzia timorensis]HJE90415.1 adenylate kinase [Dietzia timorensis]
MRIVLVGPPGAGKGTQAALLSEKLGVPHISTGDLFRANISENTELGQTAKSYIDAGNLVPSSVTNDMVAERIAEGDAAEGFLLDGYPRSVEQADALKELLAKKDLNIDAVLEFAIDDDTVVERMLARGRADDTEEVIRHRMDVYRSETAPLLDYYSDKVVKIDAVGEVNEISERAMKALGK